MAIKGIDHVVMRVKDIEAATESYKKLGMELTRSLETPGIGKQAIFRLADGTFIELVAPLSPDSPIGRAIESRGEGAIPANRTAGSGRRAGLTSTTVASKPAAASRPARPSAVPRPAGAVPSSRARCVTSFSLGSSTVVPGERRPVSMPWRRWPASES